MCSYVRPRSAAQEKLPVNTGLDALSELLHDCTVRLLFNFVVGTLEAFSAILLLRGVPVGVINARNNQK